HRRGPAARHAYLLPRDVDADLLLRLLLPDLHLGLRLARRGRPRPDLGARRALRLGLRARALGPVRRRAVGRPGAERLTTGGERDGQNQPTYGHGRVPRRMAGRAWRGPRINRGNRYLPPDP